MKTFESLKDVLRWFGIFQQELGAPRNILISAKICSRLVFTSVLLVTPFCFFAFEARTFYEYTESYFFGLLGALVLSWYSHYLCKESEFAELIQVLDVIIDKSKLEINRFI